MTSTVALACLLVLLLLSLVRLQSTIRSSPFFQGHSGSYNASGRLSIGFREICRSVLDPNALTFLTRNAPAHVVASFRIRQQQLAHFSLRVASEAILHGLAENSLLGPAPSLQSIIRNSADKVKATVVLLLCAIGHAGLWLYQCLNWSVPRHAQLWLPTKVLSAVGATMNYLSTDSCLAETVGAVAGERDAITAPPYKTDCSPSVIDGIREALSRTLPNDLSRMVYLATLRDNNTGGYFHPDLARRFTVEASDRAMLLCHQEVYQCLVSLGLEDLTDQLDVYMGTMRAPKARAIENWAKLRAYRVVIPIDADPISAEILFMKIEVALAILEARLPVPNQ